MTEYSHPDVQAMQVEPMRAIDVARGIECVALVAGAGFVVATLALPGMVLAGVLVGMAAILRPRERLRPVTRDSARQTLVRRLTAEAMVLRWRYLDARKLAMGEVRSQTLWKVRRDITVWLENSVTRLDKYPEVGRILRSHRATGGVVDELDSALQRLGDIRRLCSISERLKLPF